MDIYLKRFDLVIPAKIPALNRENLCSDTSVLLFSGEGVLPDITKKAATFPEKRVTAT
ncbi:MAG: hypothetical protein LBP87_11320 [Planctomycetaceae bacterium]|nr:hypothetical protein [Planctomycetaceae bacterium]